MRYAYAVGLQGLGLSVFMSLAYSLQLITPVAALSEQLSGVPDAFATQGKTVDSPLFRETGSFSLPLLEPYVYKDRPILNSSIELKGTVSVTEQLAPDPYQIIGHLVDSAIQRDATKQLLERKARFHDKSWTRFWGRSKDMLQYMTSYQGFETSSEAADVILEEKLKPKNRAAVEFIRQKRLDAAHLQLTLAVMEIASGLGLNDEQSKQEAIDSGLKEMKPLVGEEQACQTLQSLLAWSKQIAVPASEFDHKSWDVLTMRRKSTEMLAYSLSNDDVVKSIEDRLHRYNHIGNFSRATSKFVNTSMSLIALCPTIASPAAQGAQFVYVACTGGPEEKKVLKEVYLDRCFESRFNRLSEESALAANNYNDALLTHNGALFCCAKSLMEGLTNADMVNSLTMDSEATFHELPQKTFGQRI